ncbi:MAG: TIGR03936 family radical SAM-associated protein [Clostridiales bacterium]|nr:TIGR03936 family radical SAM-associated protein [Clostridiales bacterium]
MKRCLVEFTKTGSLIYLSHLDLTRLFLRVLRMTELRPSYSQGFNPHPKMSLALPLPLGVHSVCEWLEFETEGDTGDDPLARLNARFPEGVHATRFLEKPAGYPKSLASYVDAASYEILIEGVEDAPKKFEEFFALPRIPLLKERKGRASEVDIRPQMLDHRIVKDMPGRLLASVTLSAGAGNTLNPLRFTEALLRTYPDLQSKSMEGATRGFPKSPILWNLPGTQLCPKAASPARMVTRTAILGADGNPLL